jgi:hypothetical protein
MNPRNGMRIVAVVVLGLGIFLFTSAGRDYLKDQEPIPFSEVSSVGARSSPVQTYTAQAILDKNRAQIEADRNLEARFYLILSLLGFGCAGMGLFILIKPGAVLKPRVEATLPSILNPK